MMQVLDFLLVMDIVLQFFRAYVNKKSVLVVQLARIRRNYLGTTLLPAFTALPTLLRIHSGAGHALHIRLVSKIIPTGHLAAFLAFGCMPSMDLVPL